MFEDEKNRFTYGDLHNLGEISRKSDSRFYLSEILYGQE